MPDLMPHMIGDAVQLVTEPMIDYLRGRNRKHGSQKDAFALQMRVMAFVVKAMTAKPSPC
jgi:hypothetical protein